MLRRARRITVLAMGLTLAGVTAAAADTLVDNDRMAGSYTRYDGGTDATLQVAAPVAGVRTSRAWRSTRATRMWSSPAPTTTARRSAADPATSGRATRSTNGGATWRSSLVPGLSGRRVAARLAVADQGQLCLCRGPDAGVRRRRASVLRLHLLQPREADQRLDLRRALRRRRRELPLHDAGRAGHPVGRRPLPGQDDVTADQNNGNVYVAGARFGARYWQRLVMFKHLHRRRAHVLQADPHLRRRASDQFADLAVGPDGAVYLTYRMYAGLTGARLDRDRQVDARALVDAPSDRRDDHRVRFDRYGPDTCGDGRSAARY